MNAYRIKDRSAKVDKRRHAMVVTNRSIFVVRDVIAAKGAQAKAERLARQNKQEGTK
jgi:hypothetical protein